MSGDLPIVGNLLKAPKSPAPPPLPAAPKTTDAEDVALTEERLRRQRATGTSGNVVSNLANSVSDQNTSSRISKLLG